MARYLPHAAAAAAAIVVLVVRHSGCVVLLVKTVAEYRSTSLMVESWERWLMLSLSYSCLSKIICDNRKLEMEFKN